MSATAREGSGDMSMKSVRNLVVIASIAYAFAFAGCRLLGLPELASLPPVEDDGTITTPSFELPFSSFASNEAAEAFVGRIRNPMPIVLDIDEMREIADEAIAPHIERARSLYPVTETESLVGGVPVVTFVPVAGVAPENGGRVLINLHAGAFFAGGGGPGGAVESIPIAGTARIKVMAVDYRLGPEHRFPAASEDVEAVYRELLESHRPEDIGIYGCSAGGMLAGQSIAWFLKEGLPLPGAIGIFCASMHTFSEGDSAQLWPRMGSVIRVVPPAEPEETFGRMSPYLAGVSTKDPLAVPSASKDLLRAFPPTLFLTGTRAPEMSGAVQAHLELTELGVRSNLLLFDGMDHGFICDPALPESTRAYKLIARFFSENLGR